MYGKLAGHPALARAVAGSQLLLGAMTDAERERAVREPARLVGLRLETGLVEVALRDVAGESGALPLLSHALLATWERRDGRTLTVEGYRQSGGVGAAIAQTADSLFESLPIERRQMMRSMFLRLTELGEGIAESRRVVTINELVLEGVSPEVVDALLERLAEARLVTLGNGTAEVCERDPDPRVADAARVARGDPRGPAPAPSDRGRLPPVGRRRPRARRSLPGLPARHRGRLGRGRIAEISTPASAPSLTPALTGPTMRAASSCAPTAVSADCWREASSCWSSRCSRAS